MDERWGEDLGREAGLDLGEARRGPGGIRLFNGFLKQAPDGEVRLSESMDDSSEKPVISSDPDAVKGGLKYKAAGFADKLKAFNEKLKTAGVSSQRTDHSANCLSVALYISLLLQEVLLTIYLLADESQQCAKTRRACRVPDSFIGSNRCGRRPEHGRPR